MGISNGMPARCEEHALQRVANDRRAQMPDVGALRDVQLEIVEASGLSFSRTPRPPCAGLDERTRRARGKLIVCESKIHETRGCRFGFLNEYMTASREFLREELGEFHRILFRGLGDDHRDIACIVPAALMLRRLNRKFRHVELTEAALGQNIMENLPDRCSYLVSEHKEIILNLSRFVENRKRAGGAIPPARASEGLPPLDPPEELPPDDNYRDEHSDSDDNRARARLRRHFDGSPHLMLPGHEGLLSTPILDARVDRPRRQPPARSRWPP